MVTLLLLLLLSGESLEEHPGFELQVQESVTVQEGLCVHVPCSFSYPWNSRSSSSELYTYWYWKEDSIWYSPPVASNDPNKPAKGENQGRFLLPDARNNNCSLHIRDARRSDTGIYIFRMERGSVKYNYQDKMLNLQVTGSLQQQSGFELQVQESMTVQEGLCVHVPCSFSYPWSSWSSSSKFYTYWYWKEDNMQYSKPVASNNPNKPAKEETKSRFLLPDTRSNNCSLHIRDARRSDAKIYVFRMERESMKYTYKEKMLNLQVTALREKPHIRVREPLESGHPTQLACSLSGACKGGRPLTFSWAGAAVDSLDPQNLSSSVLTFTPRPGDHGTNLTCQVKREGSQWTTQRTIQLDVSYAPQNLIIGVSFRKDTGRKEPLLSGLGPAPGPWWGRGGSRRLNGMRHGKGRDESHHPSPAPLVAYKNLQTTSLSILEGEALRLLCEADSNPPAELSWFRGSPGLNATPLSSTAILELPRVGPAQEGEFTCQARHRLGSHRVSLSLSVVYPPQLLGPSCSWEDQGLHCSCSSRAQPAPSLHWRLGAGLLEGNHGNASHVVSSSSEGPWTNSSLSIKEGLSPDLRLSCEAWNVQGAQSASVLLLPGKAVPQTGVVPVALGGAGALALLSLCLCLIFCM
ncbi:Sialic acid-binding Ig-like lectin 5 [Myotis davidii]|uniref:Sialic acid-binding Ig-like lectin 5 n=1 Tax=Myotis davidii TaxID=225400 RepID=L5LMR4_MYODS|nr:Sialic acid-binding Ig-like lectin 5 [Myotis davidii]